MRFGRLSALAAVFTLFVHYSALALEINIDHRLGSVTLDGSTEIARGERVVINIYNSDRACFLYNASQASPPAPQGTRVKSPPTVVMTTTHQRGTASYVIKIDKREGAGASCNGYAPGPWTVNVVTVGWDLQFSAGLVVDGLTDRKYSLAPGPADNFLVKEDSNARDRTNQRAGLYAHLVNTKVLRSSESAWVPITVGLGFDDKARYMVGTSWKFGEQWFVTAGVVAGKIASLPAGVTEGMATTDQNILGTLGQKSSTSWFISASFNFLGDKAKSALEGIVTPKPE